MATTLVVPDLAGLADVNVSVRAVPLELGFLLGEKLEKLENDLASLSNPPLSLKAVKHA